MCWGHKATGKIANVSSATSLQQRLFSNVSSATSLQQRLFSNVSSATSLQQRLFSDAEVMTVPLVAALFYAGNHALTRRFLHQHGYTHTTLSARRFCRRLAQVPESAWQMVFALLSQVFQARNREQVYAIDSYSVVVCANCRINRYALFAVQDHADLRGYRASKKQYFYGFKVHLLVTAAGDPIEFLTSQGFLHDLEGLKRLTLVNRLEANQFVKSVTITLNKLRIKKI
jgi:hypothetical protein